MVDIVSPDWAATRNRVEPEPEEGEERRGIDFALAEGTIIRGIVALGPDRKPAQGKTIFLREVDSREDASRAQLSRWADTDEKGVYSFRVGPGKYELRGPAARESETLTITNEKQVVRDFHMVSEVLVNLSGTVTENGRPVPGALVAGHLIGRGNRVFEAVTDDTGRFSVRRSRDALIVHARNAPGSMGGAIIAGEDDTEMKVSLASAGRLAGRVLMGDGAPARDYVVYAKADAPGLGVKNQMFALGRTKVNGEYSFGGIPTGWTVTITIVGKYRATFAMTPVNMANAETMTLPDFTVPGE